MRVKATYLFWICSLLLSIAIPAKSSAQAPLGVVWDTPEDTATATQQLAVFSELGITHIEVKHPVQDHYLNKLLEADLTVLVRSDIYYQTFSEINTQKEELISTYKDIADAYKGYLNIAGLGLLSHSQINHPAFDKAFSPVLDSLSTYSEKSFYYYNRDKWYNFSNPKLPFGILYDHHSFQDTDLSSFDTAINSVLTDGDDQVLFIRSSWLLSSIKEYPELANALLDLKENNTWQLPLPNTEGQETPANWMVLVLLMLWAALAIQIKYLPYAHSMILRYFLAHRFFVDDILQYRERYSTPSILMMFKHALFGGLVFYIASHILLSEHGVEAFFHHLPWFAATGVNYFSFFLSGMILIIVTQLIALLWLYFPAKTIEHFSQTINLYAGIFYLDFIVVSLMVTLFTAGISTSLTLILSVIYLTIWHGSFYLAAFDSSRNMGNGRVIYLLLTIGLYTVLSFAGLLYILLNTNFIEIVSLSISL